MKYLRRHLEHVVMQVTAEYPVVLLTGSQAFKLMRGRSISYWSMMAC